MKRAVARRGSGRVGVKGNVVIDNAIRKELGIEPGWETLQWVENGRVVIEFLPPAAPGSAFGSLKPAGDARWLETQEALNAAIEEAVGEAAVEQEAACWDALNMEKRNSPDEDAA